MSTLATSRKGGVALRRLLQRRHDIGARAVNSGAARRLAFFTLRLAALGIAGLMAGGPQRTVVAQDAEPGAQSMGATVIVIRAARLLDGRGGEPLTPAMVRVDGDRITTVGSSIPVPTEARRIDLGDATRTRW